MRPDLANGSAHFSGMPKIQSTKARDMERRATQRAVWSSRVEEDVNPLTVHKESCRFYAKDSLVKAIPGSCVGVKTEAVCNGGLYIACNFNNPG